jgi:hypothetical protein
VIETCHGPAHVSDQPSPQMDRRGMELVYPSNLPLAAKHPSKQGFGSDWRVAPSGTPSPQRGEPKQFAGASARRAIMPACSPPFFAYRCPNTGFHVQECCCSTLPTREKIGEPFSSRS